MIKLMFRMMKAFGLYSLVLLDILIEDLGKVWG